MESILRLLGYPDKGRTDDPDPITGLTSRDRYLIKSSWKEKIMENPTHSGVTLFVSYFEKFPEAKKSFPFKNISMRQLAENKRFKSHCTAVIHTVGSVVDALDDHNLVVSILKENVKLHLPMGVTERLFFNLKETILDLFRTRMNPKEIEAWEKAADIMFSVISGALITAVEE